jgi:hypothetical protein
MSFCEFLIIFAEASKKRTFHYVCAIVPWIIALVDEEKDKHK